MADTPEQVLRRYYQEVWVEGKLDVLDDLLAPDYRDHDPPPGFTRDLAAARRLVDTFVSARRDAEFTIIALIGGGDQAAAQWHLEWTQVGPFLGHSAADGRRLWLRGADHVRVLGGRITDIHHVENILGTLRQIA
jgi:ketosteroid isomerase-like protein